MPTPFSTLLNGYAATPITDGESGGIVHRFDAAGHSSLFLKQGTGAVARDIADEYARLRWLQGRWAVPQIEGFVDGGDGVALLTSALPGQAAYGWLTDSPDRRPQAVRAIGDHLRRMHTLPIADCPFNASLALRVAAARANAAAGAVDLDDLDPEREGWSIDRLLARLDQLLPAESDPVVTHGDFSLDNIFLDADGAVTGCVDVGRAGIADRWQDLAILWNCLREFDAGLADMMIDQYGAVPDPSKIELYLILDEFF